MEEIPKLHGWITPEYGIQMVGELLAYLEKNGIKIIANEKEIGIRKCPNLCKSESSKSGYPCR